MKRFIIAAALVAITIPAQATDVGVSVSVGQPGFYGRIDIGDYPYPQPVVVYRQPRIVERVYVEREPIYMRVPPGHAKNWGRYCHRYNACGERVYFVQDSWYQHEYAPRYQDRYRDRQDYRRDDRDYEYRDNYKHGNGNGHGHKH